MTVHSCGALSLLMRPSLQPSPGTLSHYHPQQGSNQNSNSAQTSARLPLLFIPLILAVVSPATHSAPKSPTSPQFPSLHAFISSEAQRALKPD